VQHITLDREEGIFVITLARGKANALNCEMVDELQSALNHARADDRTHGVVLTSSTPKMFCGGFDVAEVFEYGPEKLTSYTARFIRMFDTLRNLPKPTVAGISGQCYGGGSILALACDQRIMAEGDFKFALNEVELGVVLPRRMVQALAAVVPGPTARQMFLEGHAWRAHDAQTHGIVEELVPTGNVRHRALTITRELASKPPRAFAAHKQALVEMAGGPPYTPEEIDRMAAQFSLVWFDEECQGYRDLLVAKLEGARSKE
jgi:enoyl-CoA hydratase/carnithine racemase